MPGSLGWRLQVAEAAFFLILARLLIAFVRFGRWRGQLGILLPVPPQAGGFPAQNCAACEGDSADLSLAACVERAAIRLPFIFKCLPRAMALQWMLHRCNRPSVLALATLPGTARGGLDDLHSWVECCGCVLIGASDRPYRIIALFGQK